MKKNNEQLSASMEDYLEAIYNIIILKKAARPKDISQTLKVNNSSVTEALNILAQKQLINYAPYELITLTPKGEREAKKIAKRHNVLCDFFTKILLFEDSLAENIACKVEHVIPNNGIETIKHLNNFLTNDSSEIKNWKTSFNEYLNSNRRR